MKFTFPSAQTILLMITAMVALLTWVVPAGEYQKLSYNKDANALEQNNLGNVTKLPATQATLEQLDIKIPIEKFTSGDIYKPIAIPNTYKTIKPKPQGLLAFFKAPVRGIIESADIIFLVLMIGGLIGVMNASGAFDAGIEWLANALKGHEYLLIILVTALIALGGTTFGLAEETMAFYPILIPVFLRARYDAMVGLASIFLGSAIGSMFSTTNPFSVIIASDAAGVEWTTGMTGRVIMLVLAVAITIIYIVRYANKVRKNPEKSVVYEEREEINKLFGSHTAKGSSTKLTSKFRLMLLLFLTCFIVMIYGVVKLEWWFVEMTTVFFVGAILIGLVSRMKETDFLNSFMSGASDLLGVAFIIGIARAVSIIMEDGSISDTMLYYASSVTNGINKGVFINLMMAIYSGLGFFIPSSSGMAVLTMPIMSPLADGVNIGREHIVNAYQYGQGLFFLLNPTGLILASLAMIKVGFNKWLKFILPLFFILLVFTMIGLTIGVYL